MVEVINLAAKRKEIQRKVANGQNQLTPKRHKAHEKVKEYMLKIRKARSTDDHDDPPPAAA